MLLLLSGEGMRNGLHLGYSDLSMHVTSKAVAFLAHVGRSACAAGAKLINPTASGAIRIRLFTAAIYYVSRTISNRTTGTVETAGWRRVGPVVAKPSLCRLFACRAPVRFR